MRRNVAALVLMGLSASVGAAVAGDDPPPLTPPTVSGPVAEPPAELPRALEATPIPADRGQVLVVPGVTTPRPGSRARRPGASATSAPRPLSTLPPLMGPAEMPKPGAAVGSSVRASDPTRGSFNSGRPPVTLESELAPADDLKDPASATSPGDPSRRSGAVAERRIAPAPRRPSGLFGRFFPPPPIERNGLDERDALKVEPRSDPAADAALKRRVERQVRESVGSRLRSYEVRVIGREVAIRARGVRFWQRRAVRNALESLPALSGYRATIDLMD
jgi:hypothetical protein